MWSKPFKVLQRLLFLLLLRGTMPSSWSEIMTKVGLAEAIQEAIIQEGYDAADIFGFAFTDSSALEAWLTRFQSKCEAFKDLPPAEWISHPWRLSAGFCGSKFQSLRPHLRQKPVCQLPRHFLPARNCLLLTVTVCTKK